jgi:hypothetical protein
VKQKCCFGFETMLLFSLFVLIYTKGVWTQKSAKSIGSVLFRLVFLWFPVMFTKLNNPKGFFHKEMFMKRVTGLFVVLAGLFLFSAQADAQMALRAGGGMIFEGSQLGAHASLVIPFGSKPGGLMLAAEYYKEGDVETIPVSLRGLYKLKAGSASVYLGMGSGFIYEQTVGTPTNATNVAFNALSSGTELLFSAVSGLNFKLSGPLGAFGEVTLDRALRSGATNHWAAKAGISLTFQD